MRDDRIGIYNAIRRYSVALVSLHANRVNASESDRVGLRRSLSRSESADATIQLTCLVFTTLPYLGDRELHQICSSTAFHPF